jgi:hypothetical protein
MITLLCPMLGSVILLGGSSLGLILLIVLIVLILR